MIKTVQILDCTVNTWFLLDYIFSREPLLTPWLGKRAPDRVERLQEAAVGWKNVCEALGRALVCVRDHDTRLQY